MRHVALAGVFLTVCAVTTPSWAAGRDRVEIESPLRLSTHAADYDAAPSKASVLRMDSAAVGTLWGASTVSLRNIPMPAGPDVDLELERVANPIEATWLLGDNGFGGVQRTWVPAADVVLLAGHLAGRPDRRAFIGVSNTAAQGWIETDDGLHLLSTPPDGGPTLLYRVGSERGGIDIAPPPPAESGLVRATADSGLVGSSSRVSPAETTAKPLTDTERILDALADPDSSLYGTVSGETILRLLDVPVDGDRAMVDVEDAPFGACCLAPGVCIQETEAVCAALCPGSTEGDLMFDFCGNPSDPTDPPPCWLGEGVPCDERWVCYESAEDDPDTPDEEPWTGNWVGACCYPDPANDGETLFEDKMACECAMLGGRFVAVPAFCLGEYLPEQTPAENFVSVAEIEAIDGMENVDFCSLPAGACCVEQNVVCADVIDDEVVQEFFERIGCLYIPQVLCEDADIMTATFSGTGGPGLFIKECFPCSYDVIGPDDAFLCNVEVEDNTQAPLSPKGVRCQTPRIVIDTDTWYLERFNGDVGAAQAYATLLMASSAFMFERDALVRLQIGELLLRSSGVPPSLNNQTPRPVLNPYLPGACCAGGVCHENLSYGDCISEFLQGEWQGPGSSCWEQSTDCVGDPINPDDPRPWTITSTLSNMNAEWTTGTAGQLGIGYDMVLLLSGFPYERSEHLEPTWGVVTQGMASGNATMCTTQFNPFAVAAVQGSFPYPGTSFESDDVNWDPVMVSQAVAMTIGVSVTRAYGYDRCIGLPCEYGAGAKADCDLQLALPDYGDGKMPPTIMSNCYLCEGGTANFQLRFRSEIAARIYARLANLDCVAAGSTTAGPHEVPDPASPSDSVVVPLAADDVFRVLGASPQYYDVLANDLAIECSALSDGDLEIHSLYAPADADALPDPLPVDPGGLPTATTAVTLQGGTVDIAIDPATGQQVVLYTPPAGGMCGMDVFMYLPQSSETDPDTGNMVWRLADAVATVSLIRQPQAAGSTTDGVSWAQCPPAACCVPSGLCYDDYTQAQCEQELGGDWYQGLACGDAAVPCTTFGGANPCVDAALQVTYHASINEPPAGGTPPTLPIDPCRLDRTQIDVNAQTGVVSGVSWDNVEATITDGNVTQPEELILRYWFATVPGGPPDEFVDVRPFADPATTVDCGPTVAPPLPLGPSSGSCGIAGARYVPTQNGVTAIPLEFLVQHDLVPGADACWLAGGSFGVFVEDDGGYGAVASTGACCVGGLCIETNPFDCLALAGFTLSEDYWSSDADPSNDPDPDGGERMWKRTAASSGFFMGIGTTCDQRDWCRPTAPCCYDLASGERTCSVLTPDDCWTVGTTLGNADADYGVDWGTIGQEGAFVDATTLDGTPWSDLDEAAWGFGCDWPTCFVEDPAATSIATAACCVRTSDDTFCTDLTEEACAEFGVATGWETSWSVQGSCDQIPCGSFGDVAWGGPLGACCYQYEGGSVNCESDLTFDECMNTYLTPDDPTLIPNYIQFRPGEACGGPSDCDLADPPDELGACCMSASELCCVLDTQRSDCNRMGGTWLGAGSDCDGCSQREIEAGVCCLFGMACVESMNNARCVAAGGTWHPTFTSCDAGLPCYGSTGVGFGSGACCFEYQCVDASTPGFSNTTEADCLLAGGKWLGSGACAGFPAGACDPIDCHCVEPHDGTNCDDLFDDYTVYTIDGTTCGRFGGEPSVLLGDVNEDGRVGGLPDLLPLIEDWGGPSANADLDFDGTVGIQDLLILFTEWE